MDLNNSSRPELQITRWLFNGPGFALLTVLVTASLGFGLTTYNGNLQNERRVLQSRLAAVTVLEREVETNIRRAGYNLSTARRTQNQRGVFPSFAPYMVSVWESVGRSGGIATFEANTYANLAILYDLLNDANQKFDDWRSNFVLAPLELSGIDAEAFRRLEAYRKITLRELERTTKLTIESHLPVTQRVLDEERETATRELNRVNRVSNNLNRGVAAILTVWILAVMYLLFIGVAEGFRRLTSSSS